MKKAAFLLILLVITLTTLNSIGNAQGGNMKQKADWLIDGSRYLARIIVSDDGKDILLNNGSGEKNFQIKTQYCLHRLREFSQRPAVGAGHKTGGRINY